MLVVIRFNATCLYPRGLILKKYVPLSWTMQKVWRCLVTRFDAVRLFILVLILWTLQPQFTRSVVPVLLCLLCRLCVCTLWTSCLLQNLKIKTLINWTLIHLFLPHIKVRGAWNKQKLLKGGAMEKRLRTTALKQGSPPAKPFPSARKTFSQ